MIARLGKEPTLVSDQDRWFLFLLVSITFAAFVPVLLLSTSEFISYDGYWHVFIAKQDQWKLFLSEYRRDAHPILYQLILRLSCSLFGNSRLAYRAASIIPGAVSVYMLGRTAERLCASKCVALLATAAYGFSVTMIGINIDVRSYPIALMFVIVAFYYLVNFLLATYDIPANRSLILFGVFTGLAIASEYYAIFFLVACLGVLGLQWGTHSAFRESLKKWATRNWYAVVIAFGLPIAVITYFYQTHIKYHHLIAYNHVREFYWTPGSSLIDFILRNLRADLNYLFPVQITSVTVLLGVLTVFVPLLAYFGLFQKQSHRSLAVDVPGLVLIFLLAELIVCGLLQVYPFGGNDRHQSIFFPFLTLTAFILVDRLISCVSPSWLETGILGGTAVLIAANFSYQWSKMPRRSVEVLAQEYGIFQANVAPAQALFVDQFTLIAYYIRTHDWKWKFRRQIKKSHVDEYCLTSPTGQRLVLLRNIDEWNFDLSAPKTYKAVAQSLHEAQLTSANLFLIKQLRDHADPSAVAAEKSRIRKLAADAGLEVASLYNDNAQAVITLAVGVQ